MNALDCAYAAGLIDLETIRTKDRSKLTEEELSVKVDIANALRSLTGRKVR
jgi:hypothetical protein